MHEIRSILSSSEGRKLIAPKKAASQSGGSLVGIAIAREERRRSDQRREDRIPRIADPATITFRRRKYEVELVNVSSHGAMIVSDLMPRIGEQMHIQLEGCNRVPCDVRWIRDGRIGLEFRSETVVIAAPRVRSHVLGEPEEPQPAYSLRKERAPRHGLIWRGQLHWPAGSMEARLRNISADGAMVECSEDLPEGSDVVLDLGPGGNAPGVVRWCRSGQIGVVFNEKFEMRDLAAIRPSAPSSPDMVKPRYLETDGKADSPWYGSWDKLKPEDL